MSAHRVLKHFILTLMAFGICIIASAQHTVEEPVNDITFEDEFPEFTPVSEDRLDRAMAAYQADDSFQRERPEWQPEAVEFEDFEPNQPNGLVRAIAAFFEAIGGILGYLLAAIVIIAILAGVYMVFGESQTLRLRQKEKAAAPDVSVVPDLRPEARRARALLEDADALAAEGRYAEAVHLLLFRSIDDIQEKKTGLIGRSLTAREIGALGVLPDWIRTALAPIIRIVERSFFGGEDVTESGWREARASYETFAFGEAWA